MKKPLIIISIIFIFSSIGYAEMQMWIDKDGVKHFSNTGVPQDVKVESSGEIEYDEERATRLKAVTDEKVHMKVKRKAIEDQRTKATAKANEKKQARIIAMEKRRLKKKLEYYENECITKYTGLNKGKHKEWCDFGAEKTKKRIEELENDTELYFYMKKERKKERVDESPTLGITPDGRVVPIIPLK